MPYYASARFVRKDTAENLDNETILRYKEIKYDLFRRSLDPASRRIGPARIGIRHSTAPAKVPRCRAYRPTDTT